MLFSQVREDPLVEFGVVRSLIKRKQKQNEKIKVSCITSGGCTVLSLLEFKEIGQIDCVDVNPAQNWLTALKVAVCEYFDDKLSVLNFFQGGLSKQEYDRVFKNLNLDPKVKEYWEEQMPAIYKGFNQQGKFEELFRELVATKFDYNKVFDRNYLIKIFGENAVQNSKDKEFYDHFKGVINLYQQLYSPTDNYFYHQILFDSYDIDNKSTEQPPYLSSDNLKRKTIAKNKSKLCYKVMNYVDHIKQTDTEYYDMIHTSNITDWMSKDQLNDFIKELHRTLKLSGYLIMRRLNGDYNLIDYLKKDFETNNMLDRSHFYSEVVIAKKLH